MNTTSLEYHRGDIFYANLEPHLGCEQGGIRPVLVLQNNVGNKHSKTLIVSALTSRTASKAKLPTHVFLDYIPGMQTKIPSLILLEQIAGIRFRCYYVATQKPMTPHDRRF